MASSSGSPPDLSAASTTSHDSSRSRRRFGLGRKGRSLSSSSFTRQSRRNSKDSHSVDSACSSIETTESRRRFGLGRKVRSLSASPFQLSKKKNRNRSSPPKQIVSQEKRTNIVAARTLASHTLADENYLPKTLKVSDDSTTKTPKICNYSTSSSYNNHATPHQAYYSPPRSSPRRIVYYTEQEENLPPEFLKKKNRRPNIPSNNHVRLGLVVFAIVFGLLVGGNIFWRSLPHTKTTKNAVREPHTLDPRLVHRLKVIQYETGL